MKDEVSERGRSHRFAKAVLQTSRKERRASLTLAN